MHYRDRFISVILVIGFLAFIVGGCAQDKQVMVTPFVLKHSEAAKGVSVHKPVDTQPATARYEHDVEQGSYGS